MGPSGSGARRCGRRVVEVPADWGLVGASSRASMEISTSLLQSRRSYCALGEPRGCSGTEDLDRGGAATGVTPKAEGVRLPTELDAVEEVNVKPEDMLDGGVAPRKK